MNYQKSTIARTMQYIVAISASAIICTYLCLLAINKNRSTNAFIAKTTALSFLSSEQYIEQSVKNAIIAVNYYLSSSGNSGTIDYKTQARINSIAKELGMERVSVHNEDDESEMGEFGASEMSQKFNAMKDVSIASEIDQSSGVIGNDFNYKFYSMGDGVKKSPKYKKLIGVGWIKSRHQFLVARLSSKGLENILRNAIDVSQGVDRVVIEGKSGDLIIDTCGQNESCQNRTSSTISKSKNASVSKNEGVTIRESLNFSTISVSLGAAIKANDAVNFNNYDKAAFQTMKISFSNSAIQMQVLAIISTFVAIAGLVCNTIYRYGIESDQATKIAEYEDQNSDKISYMCDEKLIEIRQSVTKAAKESMRVRSISRDIQREVTLILEKAFNKASNIEDEAELEQRREINFGGVFCSEHIRRRELERV